MMETKLREIKWRVVEGLKERGHRFDSWDHDAILLSLATAYQFGVNEGRSEVLNAMDTAARSHRVNVEAKQERSGTNL